MKLSITLAVIALSIGLLISADLTPSQAITAAKTLLPGVSVGVAELRWDGQSAVERCILVKRSESSWYAASCVTGQYAAAVGKLPGNLAFAVAPYDLTFASHFGCNTDPTKTRPLGAAEMSFAGSGRSTGVVLPPPSGALQDCEDRLAQALTDLRALYPATVDTILYNKGLWRLP